MPPQPATPPPTPTPEPPAHGDSSLPPPAAPPASRGPRSSRSRRSAPPLAQSSSLSLEEGKVALSSGGHVAMVLLTMPCIRDHQATMLEQRLRGIAEGHGGRLVVAMSEVEDITSAGINALIVVHTHCRSLGGHLAIFGLTRELRRLFKVTHLDRTIPLADDAQGAVQSFENNHRRRWFLRPRPSSRTAA